MEKLMQELLAEQRKTNELLAYNNTGKDPNELLTAEQIAEEYGIPEQAVSKMFRDTKLQVQRWTRPFKVKRKKFDEYTETNHDYLCGR